MQALQSREGITQLLVTGGGTVLADAVTARHLPVRPAPWTIASDPRALGVLLRLDGQPGIPTLLHAHDSHALSLARIAGRVRGWPVVATRRSDRVPGRWSGWRSAEAVIAISEAVADALRRGGVAKERIHRVPSAIRFGPRTAPPPTDGMTTRPLLMVGALTPEKGHATLLAALALVRRELPELRLRIVGEGPERGALERLTTALDCRSIVTFAGPCEPIGPELDGAAMLIQPSRREALGTAVLEAMAAGVPVIASRTGGLVELLDPDAGLLVPPGDPASLAGAIHALWRDPTRAEQLVQRAHQRARHYDVGGMADRTTEVYRSALRTS